MTATIILQKTNLFWPIIFFPYYERSHTIAYTGRRAIKDIKASFGFATLFLTESALCCRRIFPPHTIIDIQLSEITQVSRAINMDEILEIRFNKGKLGLLTRFFVTNGPNIPKDRLLLNLGDEAGAWYRELNKRIHQNAGRDDSEV